MGIIRQTACLVFFKLIYTYVFLFIITKQAY